MRLFCLGTSLCLLLGSLPTQADESPPRDPIAHLSLQVGIGGASQCDQDGVPVTSYEDGPYAGPLYTLSGSGVSFSAALTIGSDHARPMLKVSNMIVAGDNASGNITQLLGGIEYDGSKRGTSFVGQALFGSSTAWGTFYDAGWNNCDDDWLNSYCSQSPSVPASTKNEATTSWILQLGLGARIDGTFEIMADVWGGEKGAAGLTLQFGWNLDL